MTESKVNRDGTVLVITKMKWYCELSKLLFKENVVDENPVEKRPLDGIRAELKERVIDLYREILLYLMKSVCSCYRNRGVAFVRDIVKLDGWDGNLKSVEDAENAVLQYSNVYNTQKSNSGLEELVEITKNLAKELLHDKQDKQCFRDLCLTDPRVDKTRIERTKGGLLQDSYRWILDSADFRQWREDPQSQLLWIEGLPGKGKTMLLCGIIDELKKPSTHTCLLSFFFCQATDSRINSATAVLRGLIYLIVDQQPSLISHVRKKYDSKKERSIFEDANAWDVLSEIFTNILQDPSLKITYLIIDALDECVTELSQLLDFIIQKLSVSSRIRWIVSSRNWPEVEMRLEEADHKVRLCLEHNTESVSSAVGKYIQHKLSQLAQNRKYDEETRSAIRDHLSSNANDTFLWVALVCQNLEKVPTWKALSALKTFPPGLDSLYKRMMQQMRLSEDGDLFRRILALVMTVRRPITLKELTSFIEMPEGTANNLMLLSEVIEQCGSFLTVREHTVFFVHQSAKDFLSKNAEIFPHGMAKVHYTIFSKLLEVMSQTLHRDMYSLCTPGFPIEEVQQPDPDPLVAVRYSCVYWVEHLVEWDRDPSNTMKGMNDPENSEAVKNFLGEKYVYWLESLSLLRGTSEGVLSMAKLDDLLQVRSRSLIILTLWRDSKVALGKCRCTTTEQLSSRCTPIYSISQANNRELPSSSLCFGACVQSNPQPDTRNFRMGKAGGDYDRVGCGK